MSREYALLGNYDTALIYFDGVVKQIQQHLYSLPDEEEKQQWLKVCTDRFMARAPPVRPPRPPAAQGRPPVRVCVGQGVEPRRARVPSATGSQEGGDGAVSRSSSGRGRGSFVGRAAWAWNSASRGGGGGRRRRRRRHARLGSRWTLAGCWTFCSSSSSSSWKARRVCKDGRGGAACRDAAMPRSLTLTRRSALDRRGRGGAAGAGGGGGAAVGRRGP